MGTHGLSRQGPVAGAPLVAFDFDGTLTSRDSWTAFLLWRTGPTRAALALLRLAPAILAYGVRRDRGRLKAASAAAFAGGQPLSGLAAEAERFARATPLLRPDALACWEAWGARGAIRVIVTASPEVVVAPFARRLRADRLIATRLAVDAAGRITGALEGGNCRGEVKVERLRAAFGAEVRLSAAYGDSDGDRQMLSLADEAGMKVFHGRP